jgi:hypothetical protein
MHSSSQPIATVIDMWDWWQTLTEDQRDLLRITASSAPLSPHVIDFLAWSGCPLTSPPHDGMGPASVIAPDRLTAFIAQA